MGLLDWIMGNGESKSKNIVNSISRSITDIAASSVQDCQVLSSQRQHLVVETTGISIGGTIDMTQATDISSSCFQDVAREQKIQNEIINAVKQVASAQVGTLQGLLGGDSEASTETYLESLIKTNVTMRNIQLHYNSIVQSQILHRKITGVGMFDAIRMKQGAVIFAVSTLKVVERTGLFNHIAAQIDSTAEAKPAPWFDFGFDLGLGSFNTGSLVMYLVIIVVAVFVYKYFFAGKNISDAEKKETRSDSAQAVPSNFAEEPQGETAYA